MNWTLGTDLRDKGVYRWTFPNGRTREYRSVTSILKPHFAEGFSFVQPYIVAKFTRQLVEMAERKETFRKCTGWNIDTSSGSYERQFEDLNPRDVLKDTGFLRYEGDRFLERCAHRGSTVHALLPLWENGVRMSQDDIKYWVPDLIAERGYLCDEDEAVGYCLSFNAFLHEHQPRMRLTEKPVFHDGLGYAGTQDGFWSFDGKGWDLADVKTSEAVRPGFAEQLAAYYFAQRIGCPKVCEVASGIRRKMPRAHGAIVVLVTPEKTVPRRLLNLEAAWVSFQAVKIAYDHNHNGALFKTEKERVLRNEPFTQVESLEDREEVAA